MVSNQRTAGAAGRCHREQLRYSMLQEAERGSRGESCGHHILEEAELLPNDHLEQVTCQAAEEQQNDEQVKTIPDLTQNKTDF